MGTTVIPGVLFLALLTQSPAPQRSIEVKDLASYRLTTPVFRQFEKASRLIAVIARDDADLAVAPLFTREVSVSGDAPSAAAALEARLQSHPRLAAALTAAAMTSREYTKFALALFAARLAHGFLETGVLRRVPAGVAADNVRFVEDHRADVAAVLQALGLEDPALSAILW